MNRHSRTVLAGLLAGLFATASALAGSGATSTGGASDVPQRSIEAQKGQAAMNASGTAPASAAPPGVPAVLVLLPTPQASDPDMANGCWVRFHDDENFQGDSLTLVGPVDMANMDPPGNAWKDWDSAVVGPKARVTTYDNENFRDRTATLNPGQQIQDLDDDKLGWFEEVKSAKVACQ